MSENEKYEEAIAVVRNVRDRLVGTGKFGYQKDPLEIRVEEATEMLDEFLSEIDD